MTVAEPDGLEPSGAKVRRMNQPSTAAFKPEPVRKAREQVEQQLREAIVSGTFKRGDRLPSEAELSLQFGVSRTTIREALRALASEGLITKTPGASGGSFVQAIDFESFGTMLHEGLRNVVRFGSLNFEELIAVRQMLEIPSARLAALHRTDDDMTRLDRILTHEKATTVDDPSVPELDVEFHTSIARAARNRALWAFVFALHQVTHPVHYLELTDDVGQKTVRQHARIVGAIRNQDPDEAESAITEHLEYLSELRSSVAEKS